jgi:hypothetical protein
MNAAQSLGAARRAYAEQLPTCLRWVEEHPQALWKAPTWEGGEIVAEWLMLFVFGISAGSAVAASYARHQQ